MYSYLAPLRLSMCSALLAVASFYRLVRTSPLMTTRCLHVDLRSGERSAGLRTAPFHRGPRPAKGERKERVQKIDTAKIKPTILNTSSRSAWHVIASILLNTHKDYILSDTAAGSSPCTRGADRNEGHFRGKYVAHGKTIVSVTLPFPGII